MAQGDPAEQLRALQSLHSSGDEVEQPTHGPTPDQFKHLSNREIIEQVRIFAKMMRARFDDLYRAENNLYVDYARERQKRIELEAVLSRRDSAASSPAASRIADKLQ